MLLVQKEAKELNQALEEAGEDTEEWIEELNLSVDNCKASIEEYLNSREQDPPFEVANQGVYGDQGFDNYTPDDVAGRLSSEFSRMTVSNPVNPFELKPSAFSGEVPHLTSRDKTFAPKNVETDQKKFESPHFSQTTHNQTSEINQLDSWIDIWTSTDHQNRLKSKPKWKTP